MPSPPEIRERGRRIRIIEVLLKMEAEHAPKSDGNIRVAGEVKVYLQRVTDRAEPRAG